MGRRGLRIWRRPPSPAPDPWAQAVRRHAPGATPPLADPPERGRGVATRWLVVGLAALLALAGAAGVLAYLAHENHDRADRWRERAVALEDLVGERTQALNRQTARLNAAATALRSTRRAVRRSEDDVADLVGRQRELAAEKAEVEDERADLEGLATALVAVAADLERCNLGLADLLSALASGVAPFPEEVDGVVAACDAADASLGAYRASFPGP